ncbi:hypothetical protein [Cytobacillus firmus]|uniref:hypothetical protein n=1 Tax=Cytobacillus firmus TaxID=1399 RepID=UPI0013314163|nr:hypothetical protein [Cytobacillus firmus]
MIKSSTPPEGKYGVFWIDTSGEIDVIKTWNGSEWVKTSPTRPEEIGAETPEGAQEKANNAEGNAKDHADQVAGEAEQAAKDHADTVADNARVEAIQAAALEAQEKVNTAKTELENTIALKADGEWVNGQLISKADKADTYTITEVDNAVNSRVSVTTYTVDQQGVFSRFESAESRITQTEQGLLSTVNKTTYQQDKATMEGSISSLTTRMGQAETSISQTASDIELKANKTDVYTKTETDGKITTVNQRISTAEASIQANAEQISLRVTKTEFDGLQIGGRNLLRGTKDMSGNSASGYNTSETYQGLTIARSTNGTTGYKDTFTQNLSEITEGEEYTLSFFAKASANQNINCYFYSPNTTVSGLSSTGNTSSSSDGGIYVAVTTEWKRYWVTWKQTKPTSAKRIIVGRNSVASTTVEIAGVMFEKGNKASDWTPAPEDVDGAINGLAGRLTTAESSITQNATQIALKVNQTEFNSLEGRMSSAESSITQQAGQISLKAEKTELMNWEKEYSVNTANPIKLTTPDGKDLEKDATYKVTARVLGTTSNTTAIAYFKGNNGTGFILEKVYELGTSSNHPEFFIDANGLPAIRLYSHTSFYNVRVSHEKTMGNLSEFQVTSSAISSKVSQTDYNGNTIASLINQTATTIKLQASRIEFAGHVFGQNATFTGALQGASGTFSGNVASSNFKIVGGGINSGITFEVNEGATKKTIPINTSYTSATGVIMSIAESANRLNHLGIYTDILDVSTDLAMFSSVVRAGSELQAGTSGSIFLASNTELKYLGHYVPFGYRGTVKAIQTASDRLTVNVTWTQLRHTPTVFVTLHWQTGSVSLSKVTTVYVENVTASGCTIRVTGSGFSSGEFIWVNWLAVDME